MAMMAGKHGEEDQGQGGGQVAAMAGEPVDGHSVWVTALPYLGALRMPCDCCRGLGCRGREQKPYGAPRRPLLISSCLLLPCRLSGLRLPALSPRRWRRPPSCTPPHGRSCVPPTVSSCRVASGTAAWKARSWRRITPGQTRCGEVWGGVEGKTPTCIALGQVGRGRTQVAAPILIYRGLPGLFEHHGTKGLRCIFLPSISILL